MSCMPLTSPNFKKEVRPSYVTCPIYVLYAIDKSQLQGGGMSLICHMSHICPVCH
jgi:hypothetical protein